jgi:hypothetical protein
MPKNKVKKKKKKKKMQAFYFSVPRAECGNIKFLHLESLYKLHELQFS